MCQGGRHTQLRGELPDGPRDGGGVRVVGPGLEVAPVHREHVVVSLRQVVVSQARPVPPPPPVTVPPVGHDDGGVLGAEVGAGEGLLGQLHDLVMLGVLTVIVIISHLSSDITRGGLPSQPGVKENIDAACVDILAMNYKTA